MKNTSLKKNIVITAIIFGGLFLISSLTQSKRSHAFTIGILQTASHPALDAARNGFISTVKKCCKRDVSFIIQNAEGITAQAQTIAQQFGNDPSIDLVFSIATPATQAVLHAAPHKQHVFTAVTSPDILEIEAGTPLTGCCDMIDIPQFITSICALNKEARRFFILHNQSEASSALMAERMVQTLGDRGITPHLLGVNNESEMPLAATKAAENADCIVCPIDNCVASSIDCIARIAQTHNTPLFVCDKMLMREGVTAAAGVNYHSLGMQSGKMACDIIHKGISAHQVPIEKVTDSTLVFSSEEV